jgi:hypothetical protein
MTKAHYWWVALPDYVSVSAGIVNSPIFAGARRL